MRRPRRSAAVHLFKLTVATIANGRGMQRPSPRCETSYAQKFAVRPQVLHDRVMAADVSVEFFSDVLDALRQQVFGDLALGHSGEDFLGGGNGGIGGSFLPVAVPMVASSDANTSAARRP